MRVRACQLSSANIRAEDGCRNNRYLACSRGRLTRTGSHALSFLYLSLLQSLVTSIWWSFLRVAHGTSHACARAYFLKYFVSSCTKANFPSCLWEALTRAQTSTSKKAASSSCSSRVTWNCPLVSCLILLDRSMTSPQTSS